MQAVDEQREGLESMQAVDEQSISNKQKIWKAKRFKRSSAGSGESI